MARRAESTSALISYSIYLMHGIVLKGIAELGLQLATRALPRFDLAAILGVSMLTYHGIEQPARRALWPALRDPGLIFLEPGQTLAEILALWRDPEGA